MIVSGNNEKQSYFRNQVSAVLKFFPKLTTPLAPIFSCFKKPIVLVLLTIIVWSFLLAVVIHRKAHTQGFEELALALNIKGRDVKYKTAESVKAVVLAPFRWLKANLSGQVVPKLNIDIKFKHMQKLRAKREQALSSGMLVKAEDDYVPGKIMFQGTNYRIKLRLKGDWTDHLEGDKWSFRIHVKGDNHLLGMSRFSIQHPRTRNFESEILFFETLRRAGILAPRYFFVEVAINGKNIGLMALEEHFSKELLESQRRREGVIVRFDEDLFWKNVTFDNFKTAKVTPFRSNKVARSTKLSKDFTLARNLLNGFVRGHLKPSQVFDPILMGKFIAVADVWGTSHVLRWHNMRFYYNPITALLEPIGFDAHIPKKEMPVPPASDEPIVSAILNGDPTVKSVYQKEVEKLAREMEDGTTEKWFRSLAKKQLRILHKEFPFLNGIRFERIAKRAKDVLAISQPPAKDYPEVLQVKFIRENSIRYLELINPLMLALEVQEIFCVGENGGQNQLMLDASINFPLHLNPTYLGDLPRVRKIPYELITKDMKCNIALKVKIRGEKKLRLVLAELGTPVLKHQVLPAYDLQETLALHPFLKYVEAEKALQVLPGEWRVSEWIVVPKALVMKIPKGTTLRFDKTSGLLAKGPIFIEGTREEPVVLTGNDSFSEVDTWPGIAVLKTLKTSDWSFAKIENTSGVTRKGWALRGGVNFYESDINMDHVIFSGNRAEDALNIVRSIFELKNVTIKNTTSDAFDSDFSNGTIENGLFENIGSLGGGDGIDTSGSEVVVIRTHFKNISDKALSVGENSSLTANDVNIENVAIGAASKDGSRLFISDAKFSGIKKAGLMAYIKKSEYGPAEITAETLTFHSTEKRAIAQKGNNIFIDGIKIPSGDLNIKELYTSVVKP